MLEHRKIKRDISIVKTGRITDKVLALAMILALTGCRDRSMPNNRVINKTKTVTDVMEAQAAPAAETAPAETATTEPAASEETAYDTIDIDLTQSSETMLYSEVVDMGTSVENYVGKVIRVHGQYMLFHDEMSSNSYPTVIVLDATKCCATGLVFDLEQDNYPQEDQEFTVIGVLDRPDSEDCPFPILKHAVITG